MNAALDVSDLWVLLLFFPWASISHENRVHLDNRRYLLRNLLKKMRPKVQRVKVNISYYTQIYFNLSTYAQGISWSKRSP